MPSFNVSCDKTSLKLICNKEIEITTKIGIVDLPSEVTICFSLDSKSCFFVNESNQEDHSIKAECKKPFSMLPANGYISKKFAIKIGCAPQNDRYYTNLKISAQTNQGQNAQTEISLTIDCYSNFFSRLLNLFRS